MRQNLGQQSHQPTATTKANNKQKESVSAVSAPIPDDVAREKKAIPGWRKKEEKNGGNIAGGSYDEALSNENLDNSLAGLHVHALDARVFYDYRTELDPSEQKMKRSKVREAIAERLKQYGVAFLPVHVRFHWATAHIQGNTLEEAVVRVIDPAPSPATKSDLKIVFKKLGIPLECILSLAKQPKGSNQCGLHVILTALISDMLLAQGMPLSINRKRIPQVIDLDPWRPLLAASGNKQVQWTPEFKEKMLAAVPQVRELLQQHISKQTRYRANKNPGIIAGATQEQIVVTRHKNFCSKCHKSYTGEECETCKSKVQSGSQHPPPQASNNKNKPTANKSQSKKTPKKCGCGQEIGDDMIRCRRCHAEHLAQKERIRQQEERAQLAPRPHGPAFVPTIYGKTLIQAVNNPLQQQSSSGIKVRMGDDLANEIQTVPLTIRHYLPQGHFFPQQIQEAVKQQFNIREQELKSNSITKRDHEAAISIRTFAASVPGERALRNAVFQAHLEAQAMKILQQDGSLTESHRWQCVGNGRMLISDLVETIAIQLDEVADENNRVLGPNRILSAVQNNDLTGVSEILRSKANVTFPMILPETHHYIQVEHEHGSQHIIIGDPLFHNVRQDGTLDLPIEYRLHLGRIIRIFREHGRKVSEEVLLKRVPIQVAGSNDCGPYALRSCTVTALRVPDYDRLVISRRHLQDLQEESHLGVPPRVRFVVPDQLIEKRKCPGHCHNGGDKLLPGSCWCPNCHPVLDPPTALLGRCSHAAKGKHCQANRIPVIGCEHCLNHTTPAEMDKIKAVVFERLQPKGHPLPGEEHTPHRSSELEEDADQPAETSPEEAAPPPAQDQSLHNGNKPRSKPAMSAKKLLAQLSMGVGRKEEKKGSLADTFEVEFQYQDLRGLSSPKRVWIQLKRKPSWERRGRGRVQSAEAIITAKYCEFCNAWHESPKDGEGKYLDIEENTMTLPDPELTFYSCEKVDRKVSSTRQQGETLNREAGFAPDCHLDEDELGSDIDEGESYYDSGHPDIMSANAREQMQPASGYQGVSSTSVSYTVRRFREWKIVEKKPDRVPLLEWSALSPSTRKNHIKILHEIQQLPFRENNTALPDAIVNMVLERGCSRGWRWSTAATYLSSCASACRNLTFYTDANSGIDLSESLSFKTALSQACKLAKSSIGEPVKSRAFTLDDFNRLSNELKESDAWYLLQLTWYIAGRIGDVRRLVPKCIYIDLESARELAR